MRKNKRKELIINLIQQDLKHSQFIMSLDKLGLRASDFHHLNTLEIVSELMGVPEGDISFRWGAFYHNYIGTSVELGTLTSLKSFRPAAESCYRQLKGVLDYELENRE